MKRIFAYINSELRSSDNVSRLAQYYENSGTDGLVIVDFSKDEDERERYLELMRGVCRSVDIPVFAGCYVKRFEDIKKAFYTGAEAVLLRLEDISDSGLLKEGTERFGKDNVFVVSGSTAVSGASSTEMVAFTENGVNITAPDRIAELLVYTGDRDRIGGLLADEETSGVMTDAFETEAGDALAAGRTFTRIMQLKNDLRSRGIGVNTYSTDITFAELKKNPEGLVPCIVQDYRNNEVLMLAYMDEMAYNETLATGVMTYHSRSRNELWIKGETSGHYQYLKELRLDCDSDTLLAKVSQVGAACHTGSRSCFFNELIRHDFDSKDISKVLTDLYGVILDRKANPREGSYTNYLFDKGIDKILKKCGEEATEMVIAAKNPNAEELKYEIADLMYHMSVLMVECGVDWDDVAGELANR